MKHIAFFISIFVFVHSTYSQRVYIKVKGSDTCLPLLQKSAEVYSKRHQDSEITIVGGGSGVGIAALLSGTTDVAMASRKMKLDERIRLKKTNETVKEVPIAQDDICIVVNPANKINRLTKEQLADIYTGKIKNWKELGGDDLPIVILSRETNSGTYETFKEKVLKGRNYAKSSLMLPSNGSMVHTIGQTTGAIGYIGFSYVEKTTKTLAISFDYGKNYVLPSKGTTQSKQYPLIRTLQLYFLAESESKVEQFIDFMLSEDGAKLLKEEGYIPLESTKL